MTFLRQIGALLWARFFNLYTLRAVGVAMVAAIAPALDPRIVGVLNQLLDALAGDKTKLMLAVFGGFYVLADIVRANKKAVPAGSPASWPA